VVDSITAEIVRGYLLSVTEEMNDIISMTAMSPVFNEGHDYSTAIFAMQDREIDLVALTIALPEHIFASKASVEEMMRVFGADRWSRGDVGLVNDPYHGGSHLPDMTVAMPVFAGDRPLLFPVVRAHQLDVGGPVAAFKNVMARDIWQEGFRIYPIKVFEAGERRDDVWRMLVANTRLPTDVDNDLSAIIGACRVASERLEALLAKYGATAVEESLQLMLANTERQFREHVTAWPDGEYDGVSLVDSDWAGTVDIDIRAKVTVKGDSLAVDFTGTHEQCPGIVNSPPGNSMSWVYIPFTTLFPDIPVNSGLFRAIDVVLPEGTVVNPIPPVPTGQSTTSCGENIGDAVMKAIEKIAPERTAFCGIDLCFLYQWGIDRRYGTFYLGLDYLASAVCAGGAYGADGWGAYAATHSGLRLATVEVTELQYPFQYLELDYITDSGAPGRWRGVPGCKMVRKNTEDAMGDARVNILVCGSRHPASGFAGGSAGVGNYFVIDPDTPNETKVETFAFRVPSPPGQVVISRKGGGGGWGNPLDRDPDAVLADVLDEYVSIEGARRDYGVVIDPAPLAIDEAATTALRSSL